ncbi:MAG: Gfo/Idh/MocA family oxidoreductase [Tepidisphaeraceae bacterium]|jgi:predicted dehydrogenase
MSKKLRLGAVGIGHVWSWAHAKPWLNHPEIEFVGVCDIAKEKADQFAADHSIKHSVADYHELLKLDLDLVDICTPNLYHSEIAVAALERGCNVFTEKPDAISPEEALKMADAARKSGKVLMAMRNNRWHPATRFLNQYIQQGNAGEIYTGRCGWQRRRGIPGKGGWFTTKALSGGGPLIDLGVHFIDIAIWLMGNPRPVAVSGATYCKFAQSTTSDSANATFGDAKENGVFDVEDLAMGFIRFDNGASLQIEFSWASNVEGENTFVELRGTKAGCFLTNWSPKVLSETDGHFIEIAPRPAFGEYGVHRWHLIDVVEKRAEPFLRKLPGIESAHFLKNGSANVSPATAGQAIDTAPRLAPSHKFGPHGANLWHFVDVVQKRAEPINTPQDGVHMIKIISAIYASAQCGSEIRL